MRTPRIRLHKKPHQVVPAPGFSLAVLPARAKLTHALSQKSASERENAMAWTTPTLVEICVGLEINGYLPAEF